MVAPKVDQITLDYAGASGLEDILRNLSGVAVEGTFLWTASDEGRTVECLKPDRAGYSFHTQVRLDDVFPGLPNDSNDRNKPEFAVRIAGFAGRQRRIARRSGTSCHIHCDRISGHARGAIFSGKWHSKTAAAASPSVDLIYRSKAKVEVYTAS